MDYVAPSEQCAHDPIKPVAIHWGRDVAPRSLDRGPKTRAAKEWIDLVAYACGKIARGVVPLGIGSIAGVEAFAPALLPAVQMSHDTAMLILAASAGILVPGFKIVGDKAGE